MSASAGRVLLMPKGEYNASTEYHVLDWVLYNGRPYVAKQTTTGNTPIEHPTAQDPDSYWQLMLDFPTEVDAVPTENSQGLVRSGGVYSAIAVKANTTDVSTSLGLKADKADAFLTTDSTEAIDDADYIPFYDTSGSAKKKTLWSSLKTIVKAVFTGATSGANGTSGDVPAPQAGDENKWLKGSGGWANLPSFVGATAQANGTSGLAPAPTIADRNKFFKGDGTWGEAGGDVYMETTATLSTSQNTTVTFTDADTSKLPTNATYKVATTIDYLKYVNISCTTAGTVTVTLPMWTSAETIGVRLYIAYANS